MNTQQLMEFIQKNVPEHILVRMDEFAEKGIMFKLRVAIKDIVTQSDYYIDVINYNTDNPRNYNCFLYFIDSYNNEETNINLNRIHYEIDFALIPGKSLLITEEKF